MQLLKKVLPLAAALVSTLSFADLARTPSGDVFEKIRIPGAVCGDASPYYIYLRRGAEGKLLIHMQGGGACWNKATCFGLIPLTKLKDHPDLYGNFYVGPHLKGNPFNQHNYVYLPYCTGDIHAGNHEAQYGGRAVKHLGRKNFELALDWIERYRERLISSADELNVYGDSAGALGAMLNMDRFSELAKPSAKKLLILDSPGLHFNDKIWKRFSSSYLRDLDTRLERIGVVRDIDEGYLATQMKSFCELHRDWKIGFLQATRDVVMGTIFGKLTGIQHYFRAMGKKGLHQTLSDPSDNCSSWMPDSAFHIFGTYKLTWNRKTWDGVSAGTYIRKLSETSLTAPQRSHH